MLHFSGNRKAREMTMSWIREAISRVESDFNRSSDNESSRVEDRALLRSNPSGSGLSMHIDLKSADESNQPARPISLIHRGRYIDLNLQPESQVLNESNLLS